METFKEQFLKQIQNIKKYDIEEVTEHQIEIWDKDDLTSFVFAFDDEGNLKEVY